MTAALMIVLLAAALYVDFHIECSRRARRPSTLWLWRRVSDAQGIRWIAVRPVRSWSLETDPERQDEEASGKRINFQ